MTEQWPIHTLVFDLDDTLYLERDYVRSGFLAVDHELSESKGISGFGGLAWAKFMAGERGSIFDDVMAEMGLPASKEEIRDLVEVYRAHTPKITLLPDAITTLDWAAREFNLSLITDGYQVAQEKKIKALGLESRIACSIVTDALGRQFWKPHPESYRRVMAFFSGGPSGFLYVGDNPRKDFMGARQLGWRTMRIRRELGEHRDVEAVLEHQAEREITDLNELHNILVSC